MKFSEMLITVLAYTVPVSLCFSQSSNRLDIQIAETDYSHYTITAPIERVQLAVKLAADAGDFNGTPFSGKISRQGNDWVVSASNVAAKITRHAERFLISATVPDASSPHDPAHVNFTLYPDRAGSDCAGRCFTAWGAGSVIRIQPLIGANGYELSGRADPKKLEKNAMAVLALSVTAALHDAAIPASRTPGLHSGIGRSGVARPIPNLPAKK